MRVHAMNDLWRRCAVMHDREASRGKRFGRAAVLAVLLLSTALAAGCGRAREFARVQMAKGTNLGVNDCVTANENVGLSGVVVHRMCRDKHQKPLDAATFESRFFAEYFKSPDGAVYDTFAGELANDSDDTILTHFEIHIQHQDNIDVENNRVIEVVVFDDVWIEPSQSFTYSSKKLRFKPRRIRDDKGEPLYTWSLTNLRGVDLSLK